MSGVMQGDPASGTLRALAMDPFLRDMRSRLRRHPGCEIGACADDIGATVAELQARSRLSGVFYAADFLAGLALKIPKCRLVPVSEAFSSSLHLQVQERLAKLVPRWRSIPI
eukprot:7019029-Pyramimonas_sp.AAC.1